MFKKLMVFLLLTLYVKAFAEGIKWLDFETGLKKAKEEKKLILMDIYAEWCHWCNVMENSTYRDKEVIELINRYYIPVRVNAEKFPNINKKYNQGGLPSTVFLDWDGNIIWGAIYLSPEEMKKKLLYFANLKKDEIKRFVERNKRKSKNKFLKLKKKLKIKNVSVSYIDKTYKYVKIKFDYKNGGFKGAPKFPKRDLAYFLILYYKFRNDKSKDLLEKTLNGYAKLIDFEEGGIYRYGVYQDWSEPHYEKLLREQAEVSILYFNAYSVLKDEKYKKYGNIILKFAKEKLFNDTEKLFYNSQGADIVDENGTLLVRGEDYFIYPLEKRREIEKRVVYSPNIEKHYYFSNNALIIQALFYSYIFNNNYKDLKIALNVLDKVLDLGFSDKGVKYSPNLDKYLLNTQVYTLESLILAYEISGNKKYLNYAERLIRILNKYYYNKSLGIYTDLKSSHFNIDKISFLDDIFFLNYRLSKALYGLYLLTYNKDYINRANDIILRLPKRRYLTTSLGYFLYIYPPLEVNIISDKKTELISKVKAVFPYWIETQLLKRKDEEKLERLGLKSFSFNTVYICNTKVCFAFIKNPDIDGIIKKLEYVFKLYKDNFN